MLTLQILHRVPSLFLSKAVQDDKDYKERGEAKLGGSQFCCYNKLLFAAQLRFPLY
jgi:hypothetical protein